MNKMTAHVFGKEGCAKCAALKRRIGALLEQPEYGECFDMQYHDVLTLDGIVDFCNAACLNPNRIPALLISRNGKYIPSMRHRNPSVEDYNPSVTYQWLGIQTDYDHGGVITPDTIKSILDEAKESV